MTIRSLAAPSDTKASGSALQDALKDFDALAMRQEETEPDFLTGEEHGEELTPDESGW